MKTAKELFDFDSIMEKHQKAIYDLRQWFKITGELNEDIKYDFDTIDRALASIRQKMSL